MPTTSGGAGSGSNVTGQAIANNLSAAPDLTSLTNLINQLNIQGQQQANAARIPNGAALETKSSSNIGDLLGGIIPEDVKTRLAQAAAERGVAMGSPGSDNVNSSLLRSLGLTSLDLQQLGQQNLTAADARNPVAKLFDPTTQLITPYQQGSLNTEANRLALDWQRYLHPNTGPTGGGRGGGQPTTPTDTAPDMSWFSRALASAGNLNQPGGVAPVTRYAPPATTYNPNQITEDDYGAFFDPTYNTSVQAPTTLAPDMSTDYGVDPNLLYG
jgi:hypothetical protein